MTPRTKTLYSVATSNAVENSSWFAVQANGRENLNVVFTKTAGTGTFKLQGRLTTSDDPVDLTTAQTDDYSTAVPKFHQVRVVVSAAAGLTLAVVVGEVVKVVA